MNSTHVITMIPLSKLHPHPANANTMSPALLRKLQTHIAASGRYEPLLVRPHPQIAGEFQLINGHHRKRILERLGHAEAACLIWNLDDAQTLLLLATINRLSGRDSAGKRLTLLRELQSQMPDESLAAFLPEDDATLAKILAESPPQLPQNAPALDDMEEAFTLFLPHRDLARLRLALAQTHPNPSTALMHWLNDRTKQQQID